MVVTDYDGKVTVSVTVVTFADTAVSVTVVTFAAKGNLGVSYRGNVRGRPLGKRADCVSYRGNVHLSTRQKASVTAVTFTGTHGRRQLP